MLSIVNKMEKYADNKMERIKIVEGEEIVVDERYVERSIVKRFRKEIWRKFVKAINEYDMIQDGFHAFGKVISRIGTPW